MSLKSNTARLLNNLSELVHTPLANRYVLNTGLDNGLSITYFGELLIEVPFVLRNIRPLNAKVLDVGCCESLMPIQLAMIGYEVILINSFKA